MIWLVASFGVFSAIVAARTGHWVAAVAVSLLVAIQLWRAPWARLFERRASGQGIEPEVKQYPPGCTCVFGAFLDNPSCPHHRDERWQ